MNIEHKITRMQYLDFRKGSENEPEMVDSRTGILPDRVPEGTDTSSEGRVGMFADMMPQSIITRVVAYNLSEIWLYGSETSTLIDNLYATIVPDIRKEIKIKKL